MFKKEWFKKIWHKGENFFKPPRLNEVMPALHPSYGYSIMKGPDAKIAENMQNIALADLQLQRDALQKNLIVMHRTMIVAIFAIVFTLLGTFITAVITLNSQRDTVINLEVKDEQKTIPEAN